MSKRGRPSVKHTPAFRSMQTWKTEGKKPTAVRYSLAKRISIAQEVASGKSIDEVCEIHAVAKPTVIAAVKDPVIQELTDNTVTETRRKHLANFFEYNAERALMFIDEDKLEKMSAYQLMMIAAVGVDKARLLQGLSTENISIKSVKDALLSELDRLKKNRASVIKVLDGDYIIENKNDGSNGNTSSLLTNGSPSVKTD